MKQISTQAVYLIPPDNVQMHWVDPSNGLLANEACVGASQFPYITGSEPELSSPCLDSPVNRTKTWLNDFFENNF